MELLKGKIYDPIPIFNTIKDEFRENVKKYADREAFAWRPDLNVKTPTVLTYKEVEQEFDALQVALYDPTIEVRRIAIVGVNSYHWSLSYLATVCGLGVVVPLDPLLTATELVTLLKRGETDTLICDARFIPLLAPYFEEMPFIKHRYCMIRCRETGKKGEEIARLAQEHGFIDFEKLLEKGKQLIDQGQQFQCPPVFPDTDAALLFTSGTTSESKGVMISHYNITCNVAGIRRFLRLPKQFNYLSILPIHHCLENTCGLHAVMSYGGKVCYCDGLRYINQNLEEYKPHLLVGVPALYDSFYKKIMIGVKKQGKEKSFERARKISKFLRKFGIDIRRKLFKAIIDQFGGNLEYCISGAAHQRAEVIEFLSELGITIYQGYGLTECAPVVSGCNTTYNPIGTCGYPLGGMTIAIDNDSPGEDGEILVKIGTFPNHREGWDPNKPIMQEEDIHIVMKGYYQNPEATAEVFEKDGWFRTMDIGHIDPKTKGLVLTGRAKSMIVLNSGKKVFPEEIESKINCVDLIGDSLVWAESVHGDLQLFARLVLDSESLDALKNQCKTKGMSDEEIAAHIDSLLTNEIDRINSEMIKFKRIRHFYYSVEDIIKTTTRKIKRKPEIELLHNFFKSLNIDGLELEHKNLDTLGFSTFIKGEK